MNIQHCLIRSDWNNRTVLQGKRFQIDLLNNIFNSRTGIFALTEHETES